MSELDQQRMFGRGGTSTAGSEPSVPGRRTLLAGPTPKTTRDLPPERPADDVPADWHKFIKISPPCNPFRSVNVVPGRECPKAPNSVLAPEPYGHHDTSPHSNTPGVSYLTSANLKARQVAWDAYLRVAAHVQGVQDNMEPYLVRYQHAERDEDLRALDFQVPRDYKGTLADLAGRQQMPEVGGMRIGDLFHGDNTLALDEGDKKDLGRINPKTVGTPFRNADEADARLEAAVSKVAAASHNVAATEQRLKVALADIEKSVAKHEVAEAAQEVAELKEGAAHIVEALEWMSTGPAKIMGLITERHEVGGNAAMIVRLLPIRGLEEAQRKLAVAQIKLDNAKLVWLQANLGDATSSSCAAIAELASARQKLVSAMLARRTAHAEAGTTAAAGADGSPKIAAVVSAIPIVAHVAAALRHLANSSSDVCPSYNDDAGRGYGIALQQKLPEAIVLPQVIGPLLYCGAYYGDLAGEWEQRLAQLQSVRDQIRRGGDNV